MKVYLDDQRPAPVGWTRAYWPDEVIRLLRSRKVEVLSHGS
ncbi:cyclic-phosphate processing receiver domain-containing protein [Pseudomonas sp. JY-Q]